MPNLGCKIDEMETSDCFFFAKSGYEMVRKAGILSLERCESVYIVQISKHAVKCISSGFISTRVLLDPLYGYGSGCHVRKS